MFSNANSVPCMFKRKADEANEEVLGPAFGHKLGGMFGDISQSEKMRAWALRVKVKYHPMQEYTKNEVWSSVM
jgi:hypothetical protein